MEEHKEKKLDDFVSKMVKEAGLEEPSPNFTEAVLSKIEMAEERSITVYKPLISKFSWGVLVAMLVGIGAFVLFGRVDTEISWFQHINFDLVSKSDVLNSISNLTLPNTLVYGILGLAFFIYIQIFLLKNHLDKRFFLQ